MKLLQVVTKNVKGVTSVIVEQMSGDQKPSGLVIPRFKDLGLIMTLDECISFYKLVRRIFIPVLLMYDDNYEVVKYVSVDEYGGVLKTNIAIYDITTDEDGKNSYRRIIIAVS